MIRFPQKTKNFIRDRNGEDCEVTVSLLEKVEIPTEFRDVVYFFSNRDGNRDRKSS
jgi:hypothetical protein